MPCHSLYALLHINPLVFPDAIVGPAFHSTCITPWTVTYVGTAIFIGAGRYFRLTARRQAQVSNLAATNHIVQGNSQGACWIHGIPGDLLYVLCRRSCAGGNQPQAGN